MFGLMRAKKCGRSEAEKHFRRLNYCGTCKTIGSLYGRKSRLLLNHDTVFLAEILSVSRCGDCYDGICAQVPFSVPERTIIMSSGELVTASQSCFSASEKLVFYKQELRS